MKNKINLTEKNHAELTALLSEKREELRTLRFSGVGSRLKDNSAPKKARAAVARIMTELGARTRAAK